MKFDYYGKTFEFDIRDVYSKYGFGYEEDYTGTFAERTIDFIEKEMERRKLPYTLIRMDDNPEFIEFEDKNGNRYNEHNEPADIQTLMDELDGNQNFYKELHEKEKEKNKVYNQPKHSKEELLDFINELNKNRD